jgi:hypothetical protein
MMRREMQRALDMDARVRGLARRTLEHHALDLGDAQRVHWEEVVEVE